jgi:hypothetical protein
MLTAFLLLVEAIQIAVELLQGARPQWSVRGMVVTLLLLLMMMLAKSPTSPQKNSGY